VHELGHARLVDEQQETRGERQEQDAVAEHRPVAAREELAR
jgi:hypothetical protein